MFLPSQAMQPCGLRRVVSTAALASLLAASPLGAEEQTPPPLLPTRDVDITYRSTRPVQPTIVERRRWSASDRLVRSEGPDKSTTLYDRDAHEITILNPKNRTYVKLEGSLRQPLDPEKGKTLKRGGDSLVAGLHCTDWSWTEDAETHTVCLTLDGVMLRLVVDGKTVMQALSVKYGRQPAELFRVPPDYTPALAPEGGSAE
jgi:hypothetical protein